MKKPVTYCKSWFRAMKQPTEVWSEKDANSAHDNKTLYGVVVGPVDHPFCFIEVNKGFVGVGFLDELSRETLYYAFKEVREGTLFLGMATYRDYVGNTDKVASGTTYRFDESGAVRIEKQTFNPLKTESSASSCDVAKNYATWPEFGRYDDLIEVERG